MSAKRGISEWKAHIESAHREGKKLAVYAREHGLSVRQMYKVQRHMRRMALQAIGDAPCGDDKSDARQENASPFVEVKVKAPAVEAIAASTRLLARLPNGVEVELACGGADADLVMAMMDALVRAPCSVSTRT